MDARDAIAAVGLLLLAGGLWFVYQPLAFITPGAILTWFAFISLRANGPVDSGQADPDQHQH